MDFLRQVRRQTPESVELEFVLAGIGSRAYALLVDYMVLAIALTLLFLLTSFLASFVVASLSTLVGTELLEQWLIALAALAGFTIYVGYFVLFESIQNGQTPGKKRAKIQVVCDDGRPVRFFQAAMRALLRPVDDLLWIGFFLIALGPQEKRLGDWLGGTLVVQTQAHSTQSQTLDTSDDARAMVPEFRQTLDLSLLTPDDFAVLRQYLQRRQTMKPDADERLASKLASEICHILMLEQQDINLRPQLFLEVLYLAYQEQEEG